jgi:hypothetical protein
VRLAADVKLWLRQQVLGGSVIEDTPSTAAPVAG